LKDAQITCKPGSSGGGQHDSKCLEQKAKENEICKTKNCIPKGANCEACTDTTSSIEIKRVGSNGIDWSFCRAEVNPRKDKKNNIDYLIGILVHEAAHACTGPHNLDIGEGKFCHQYGVDGVATDACGRPDPYSVQAAFLACNKLNTEFLFNPPKVPERPK